MYAHAVSLRIAMSVIKSTYLLVPTLPHTVEGSSSFSMMYSVTKLPPSLSGGFHDNTTESSRMFSTTGNLGGSGRSETFVRFNCQPESKLDCIRNV